MQARSGRIFDMLPLRAMAPFAPGQQSCTAEVGHANANDAAQTIFFAEGALVDTIFQPTPFDG